MKRNDRQTHRIEPTSPAPTAVRLAQLEDVRRRLEAGELDSTLALVETALALLDGDDPAGLPSDDES